MVYYRKYRPQAIDDLDSSAVREALFSVFQKEVPHAFLFTGPKGLGKTSAARIVAKAVNCERVPRVSQVPREEEKKARDTRDTLGTRGTLDIEPCNECEQCVSITNGTNLDVLEIDAASNRGIDEIRDLKEKVRLAPVSASKKVYIIDEVHMLTTEAFNALLKTLEEPPSHAIFILCTTEAQKIPSTILSRCFHVPFRLASIDELKRSFKRVALGEGLDIDEEALEMIALLSEGGFRDGTKILEELALLGGGKKITKEFVEEKYHVSSIKYLVVSMIESLGKKDVKGSLEIISKLTDQGVDFKYFLQQLIEVLHQGLLQQVGIKDSQLTINNLQLTITEIKELFELLSKANMDMKFAVLPQLPLELAVIEYSTKGSEGASETEGSKVIAYRSNQSVVKAPIVETPDGVTVSHLRRQVGEMQKNNALYGPAKQDSSESDKPVIEVISVDLMKSSANGEITKEWQDALWKSIISEMKSYNHTIAGVLRSCTIKDYSKEQLIIEAAYKFHKERLDDMKTRDELTKICKMLTGNDLKIGVELRT